MPQHSGSCPSRGVQAGAAPEGARAGDWEEKNMSKSNWKRSSALLCAGLLASAAWTGAALAQAAAPAAPAAGAPAAAAPAAAATAAPTTIPRTADGHVNLSGLWVGGVGLPSGNDANNGFAGRRNSW